jgi:hypothetical protein
VKRFIGQAVLGLLALVLVVGHAEAQRRGGGRRGGGSFRAGGGGFRASARTSVTRRPAGVSRSVGAVNRGAVVATRPGRVVNNGAIYNRDVNVIAGGRWDNNWDGCCYYGPGRVAAGVAAGALAAAAVGTVVYSVPSSCTTTVVNGITYEQCGTTWYKPEFAGGSTGYVVVNPP